MKRRREAALALEVEPAGDVDDAGQQFMALRADDAAQRQSELAAAGWRGGRELRRHATEAAAAHPPAGRWLDRGHTMSTTQPSSS